MSVEVTNLTTPKQRVSKSIATEIYDVQKARNYRIQHARWLFSEHLTVNARSSRSTDGLTIALVVQFCNDHFSRCLISLKIERRSGDGKRTD